MSRGFRNCEVLVFAYAYAEAGEVMKFVRSLLHREAAQQRTSHRRRCALLTASASDRRRRKVENLEF